MRKTLAQSSRLTSCAFFTVIFFVAAGLRVDPATAQIQPGVSIEGEYSGQIYPKQGGEAVDAGLVVTSIGDEAYRGELYLGGLTDERSEPAGEDEKIELRGRYTDYTLRLKGEDFPLTFQFIFNRFTALDEGNNYMGHLDRVIPVAPGSSGS